MNILQRIQKSIYSALSSSTSSFTTILNSRVGRRSHYQLLQQYKNLVYACVTAIANDVARVNNYFYREDVRTNTIKIVDHPFGKVLKNPNPLMSYYDLKQFSQSYVELVGEAFWYVALGEVTRKPKEIYIMRPDRVDLVVENGVLLGYVFNNLDGKRVPLELDEVLHFKEFNPLDPYRGLGTVQAGLLYIETENSTSQFQYSFMENQASPSGVLTVGKVTKEGFEKIKKQWKEQQSGSGNAGKTLIIRDGDAKFEKIGLSIADINMAELKTLTEERVRKMFRIPKAILGDTDATGLGRSNIEAIEYSYAKRVIEPKLVKFDNAINLMLKKWYKDDVKIGHDSAIPEDKEAQLNEDNLALGRWKTTNEIRQERGLPPIEGGDDLYYNFNQVPLGSEETRDAATSKSIVLKTTKTHASSCGCGDCTPVIEQTKTQLKKKYGDVRDESEQYQDYVKITDKIEDKSFTQYRRELNKLLKKQEKLVLEKLENFGSKKEVIVDIEGGLGFNLEFSKDDLQLKLLPALIEAIRQSAKATEELYQLPPDTFTIGQGQLDAIFSSTERLVNGGFNKETAEKIQKQIAAGLRDNETTQQIADRIRLVYTDTTTYRAERIARTEAHKATNYGVAETYKLAGFKQMRWVANVGACPFCAAMNGSITTIGRPFVPLGGTIMGTDGSELIADYDAIKYADAHPNCRCTLIAVPN